jgi:4-carboxymuconolactone decarboxylase
MRLNKARVEPLPEAEWTPEIRETLPRGVGNGRILAIFTTLARHPKLLKRWLVFGNHVLFKSTLGPRERELAILRIGYLCRSEYEWGQHAVIGRGVGLTDAEIERVILGPDAPGWTPLEALVLRATDELHGDSMITDATWSALSAHYDVQQLMDLIFAVGQYTMVSMALNSLGVQLDQGIQGFPAGHRLGSGPQPAT